MSKEKDWIMELIKMQKKTNLVLEVIINRVEILEALRKKTK